MPNYGTDTYIEWYPVHLLDPDPKRGDHIELSEEEYKDYCEVLNKFLAWQKRIAEALNISEGIYYFASPN
jgi:hypothetical protein